MANGGYPGRSWGVGEIMKNMSSAVKAQKSKQAKTKGKQPAPGVTSATLRECSELTGDPGPIDPYDPHCFLICPFDPDDGGAAQRVVADVAREHGFGCYRADQRHVSTDIISRVREGLAAATFVVADLTRQRPNCLYEVGFADALKRPIILICKDATKIPFDVAGRSILKFDTTETLRTELKRWIMDGVLFSDGPESDDDQNKGEFGRLALRDGYLLSGYMTADRPTGQGKQAQFFQVFLSVRSVRPDRPLEGNVEFFLDPATFEDDRVRVRSVGGIAKHDFWCWGSFTVGVEIRAAGVRLELDLRYLPGATDTFRAL